MDAAKGGGKGKGKGPVQQAEFTGKPHPTCPVKLRSYDHIAVIVTDEAGALEFYGKFGFKERSREGNCIILANPHTVEKHEIHLLLQPCTYAGPFGKDTGVNVLMDVEDKKAPGHTHIAFNVPSLPSAKEYLTLCTVHITGERPNAAYFVRDQDRNVVELVGPVVGENTLAPDSVLVSVHHMGTRVGDIHAAAKWYSEVLSFGELTMWYEPADVPKVNGGPWVLFNQSHIELNLLLNSSITSPEGNVMLEGSPQAGLCPGIFYFAMALDNFDESVKFLQDKGVPIMSDADAAAVFGKERISPPSAGGKSVFIRDPDGNVIRLVN